MEVTLVDQAKGLNHLIATCQDGVAVYELGAAHVNNRELQRMFRDVAIQRMSFYEELEQCFPRTGEVSMAHDGTAGGAIQRGWIAFREALNWEDEVVVLAELDKYEKWAVSQYEHALKGPLPASCVPTAIRQLGDIRLQQERLEAIYHDPNKSVRGVLPGTYTHASGTTPAGRSPVPDKYGVTHH